MQAKEQRRAAMRAECAARGIAIEQRGQAYRLQGVGVDLIVIDLANVDANDLKPYCPRKPTVTRGTP